MNIDCVVRPHLGAFFLGYSSIGKNAVDGVLNESFPIKERRPQNNSCGRLSFITAPGEVR